MISKSYPCGYTLESIVDKLHLDPNKASFMFYSLRQEGYSEKGICYGVSRAEDKLLRFIGEDRIYGVITNEVRKYALKSGDPRWDKKKKK